MRVHLQVWLGGLPFLLAVLSHPVYQARAEASVPLWGGLGRVPPEAYPDYHYLFYLEIILVLALIEGAALLSSFASAARRPPARSRRPPAGPCRSA